ncbi:MAG TPA: helix-turn-helix transcriptional regulator, partial [Candidatus Acidoferrum sp.]|nr:helix-turn-helix transcriptional regulator [Candidatus Acidoferrum sp.]
MKREKEPARLDLAAAVAHQLREYRRDHTMRLDDVAAAVRQYGLMWDASTVTKIEQGRRDATSLDELLILCLALNVRLSDWIPDNTELSLAPGLSIPSERIKGVLRGQTIK